MDLSFQIPDNPLIFWLLIAFAAATFIQMLYYWGIFSALAFYKNRTTDAALPPVSVVITANNQYNDLLENLPSLLAQQYPDFEVVVVIDNSDDGTDELLMDFSRDYNRLKVVELKQKLNWFSGRKFPLSLGIKSAKHDMILLTDPACKPESDQWIKTMVAELSPKKEIVIAYSTYATGSKINRWLRFSAFYDALLYLSLAIRGFPFKGIGKNLGYSRQLFYKNKGFSSHYVISAGDDELFVNNTATKLNTLVQIKSESTIKQVKKISFSQWIKNEKTRLKIRRFFKFRDRFVLRLYAFSTFIFYGLFIALLMLGAPVLITLSVFGLRLLSQILIFGYAQNKLSEPKLLLLSPVFEFSLILIDFFLWMGLFFGRNKKWA